MKRLLYAFLIPLGIILTGGSILALVAATFIGSFNALVYFGMPESFAGPTAVGIILYVFLVVSFYMDGKE